MESYEIEQLLDKYFEGETSIADENQLRSYFSSSDVAQHLQQYKGLFGYLANAKEQMFTQQIAPQSQRNFRRSAWLSIAASAVILLGAGTFTYFNRNPDKSEDLGTYNDPEVALRETQKALSLLSTHMHTGVESVEYIGQFDEAKNKVFIK